MMMKKKDLRMISHIGKKKVNKKFKRNSLTAVGRVIGSHKALSRKERFWHTNSKNLPPIPTAE